MPHTYLCFVWHMHQPFYKDLATGEYQLPWTRMHALKDYYGMVKVLEDFPNVHQTFNLVPSMMVQIEEYAAGTAQDPFLRVAEKPAESLTVEEQEFILRYFFQANPGRLIYRYPRYAELYEAWVAADRNPARARRSFGVPALRDLQVLSQLAWFDEEIIEHDPEVKRLVKQGRDYSLEQQGLMIRKQTEIVGRVLPVYREFARKGQIELSTTPFYHPILPLVCDSDIAQVAHPHVPLPARFRYPQDAKRQVDSARAYMTAKFGEAPAGMWPSEGSVSDEALALAANAGFRWAATDNGVLGATLKRTAGVDETYRPYLWKQDGRQLHMLFRDHFLSDLIGFVYSRMEPAAAVRHFLDRIRENCAPIHAQGRDALVPIILDGENAWEYFDRSGRPFLRELYECIEKTPGISAVTVSEALERVTPTPLDHVSPGSWINSNFDVWIGAEEDNQAWELLLRARRAYDESVDGQGGSTLSDADRELAYEEILIAEGSDWCWWYGPEHHSENRAEFDKLFREHLAHVYRALRRTPPEELSRPIVKVMPAVFHETPQGPIRATLDGLVTSYFEWLGAGIYSLDSRDGAMHGKRFLVKELRYGSDGRDLYLRLDFRTAEAARLAGLEIHITAQQETARVRLQSKVAEVLETTLAEGAMECAFDTVFEVRLSLAGLGMKAGQTVKVQLSLWQKGLPVDAIPPQGWLEASTADPTDWPL